MTRTLVLAMAAALAIPAASRACTGSGRTVSAGLEDNFGAPLKPVTPSARLLAIPGNGPYVENNRMRRFDEPGRTRLFLTSLTLPDRKVCSAQFEMRIHRRRLDGKWAMDYNDYIQLGFAPFGYIGVRRQLFRATLWLGDPVELLEKTVRIPLPAVEINRFLQLTEAPHYFDIVVNNDTAVDYVRLILRFE
jgi:hypothetical protein